MIFNFCKSKVPDAGVIPSVESGPALDHECLILSSFHSDDSKAKPNRESEIRRTLLFRPASGSLRNKLRIKCVQSFAKRVGQSTSVFCFVVFVTFLTDPVRLLLINPVGVLAPELATELATELAPELDRVSNLLIRSFWAAETRRTTGLSPKRLSGIVRMNARLEKSEISFHHVKLIFDKNFSLIFPKLVYS
jgi:hypothetical protein